MGPASLLAGAAAGAAAAVLLACSPDDLKAAAELYSGLEPAGWEWGRLLAGAVRLAAVLVVAWGLGGPPLRWLRPAAVPLTVRTALGVFVLSSLLLALGLAGLAFRAATVAVFGLLLVAPAWEWHRERPHPPVMPRSVIMPGALVALPVLAAAGLVLGGLLAPENFWDALAYHLAVPARFLAEHKVFLTTPFFANFPFLVQDLSLLLLPLGGEILPRLFQAAAAAGCGIAIWDTGRALGMAGAGALAGACFVTTPLAGLAASHAGADLPLAWFSLLALAAFVRAAGAWPDGRPRPSGILLAGALCGLATATKHHGLATLGILILLAAGFRRIGWRRRALLGLLLAAGWLGPAAIHGVRSWLLTGNPVHPFLSELIPSLGWTEAARRAYGDELTGGEAILRGGGGDYLDRFRMGLFGPVAVLGLGLAWVFRTKAPAVPLLFAAGYAALWVLSVPVVRFVLPAWGAYLLVAFAGAAALGRRRPWVVPAVVAMHLASAVLWLPQIIYAVDAPWPFLRGEETREGYYARVQRNAPWDARSCVPAERPVGPRHRVLCVGEYRGYLCGEWAITGSLFEPEPFMVLARESRDSAELAKRLRQRGVGYLLVNEAETARRRVWDGREMFPPAPARRVGLFFSRRLELVHSSRGIGIYALARRSSAWASAPEALSLAPGPESRTLLSLCNRARRRLGAGRPAEALRAGWLAVGLAPKSALAWEVLGDALHAAGDFKQALGAYETALANGAHDSRIYANLGWAYADERRYGLAREAFGRAIALDPASRRARQGLLRLDLRQREFRESIRAR